MTKFLFMQWKYFENYEHIQNTCFPKIKNHKKGFVCCLVRLLDEFYGKVLLSQTNINLVLRDSSRQNSVAAYPARAKKLLMEIHHWWPPLRCWGAYFLSGMEMATILSGFSGTLLEFQCTMPLSLGRTNQPTST